MAKISEIIDDATAIKEVRLKYLEKYDEPDAFEGIEGTEFPPAWYYQFEELTSHLGDWVGRCLISHQELEIGQDYFICQTRVGGYSYYMVTFCEPIASDEAQECLAYLAIK